jgi:hypothetical protein
MNVIMRDLHFHKWSINELLPVLIAIAGMNENEYLSNW